MDRNANTNRAECGYLDSSLPLTCAGAMCHDDDDDEATRDVYLVCGRQTFLLHSLASFYSHKNNKQQQNWAKIIETYF